jgi:hypothetical protein
MTGATDFNTKIMMMLIVISSTLFVTVDSATR